MHPNIFLFDANLFWLDPIVFVLVNVIVLIANYMVFHVIVKSISLSRMILGGVCYWFKFSSLIVFTSLFFVDVYWLCWSFVDVFSHYFG